MEEEEDLEQVAALVSCSAVVQSYNKQLDWRRENMRIEIYKMGTKSRNGTRGRVRGREQDCPMRAL